MEDGRALSCRVCDNSTKSAALQFHPVQVHVLQGGVTDSVAIRHDLAVSWGMAQVLVLVQGTDLIDLVPASWGRLDYKMGMGCNHNLNRWGEDWQRLFQ